MDKGGTYCRPPCCPIPGAEFKWIFSPLGPAEQASMPQGAELPSWTCSVADIIIFIMRFYVAQTPPVRSPQSC